MMRNRLKRKAALFSLVILSMALGGCWDLWEIDERGLVLAMGIEEIPRQEVLQTEGVERQLLEKTSDRALAVTYQFAVPSGLAGEAGGGGGPTYVNLTTAALSSEVRIRGLISTRSSRKGDLTHLQVVVLGPEVAKNGIYDVLERLMRDPDVRRQVSVLVTEGDVLKVLETNTGQEPMPALYLTSLQWNEDWAGRMPPPMEMGQVYRFIREGGVFVIPRVTPGEGDLKMAGGGIFHRDRLVAWMGETETNVYRWIIGEIQLLPILIASPMSTEQRLTEGYLAERSRTFRGVELVDGQFRLKVKIDTQGSIVERQLQRTVWSDEAHAELTRVVADTLAEDIKILIKKAQEEWKLDLFGFGREVEKKYPQLWREIREEWHERYFPGALVEVDVDVMINRTGTIR